MLLLGNIDMVQPANHPYLSVLSLFFPIALFLNLVFFVFWIFFKPRYLLIPFAGFLLCYSPIRTYSPVNSKKQIPDSTIKILSYNVMMHDLYEDDDAQDNPIIDYIVKSNADIVCLQETGSRDILDENPKSRLRKLYPYTDTARIAKKADVLTIYSKFPIIHRERIRYVSQSNLSIAYKLLIGGDTVLVINNHFESNRLSQEEKTNFRQLVKGEMKRDSAERESKYLLEKLAKAAKIRAPQVDSVARYIESSGIKSVILCGDFNDHPNSYTRRVLSRKLTDCYRESGNGTGFTYQRGGIFVRIDHILCSSDWQPYNCKVDKKITVSDHYPISCNLKKRLKQ